jgi:outer membrane protein TolC
VTSHRRARRAGAAGAWALALGLSTAALGQAPALSIGEAIQKAKKASRDLESLRIRAEIAHGRLAGVTGIGNPELRIGDVSTEYLSNRVDDLQIGLRWRPPELGQTRVRQQRQAVRVWELHVGAQRAEQRLASRVRRSHARLVLQDQLLALRRTRLETETRRLALVRQMLDLGRRSVVYHTKARMWLGRARSDLTRVEQNRNEAHRDLQRLIDSKAPITVVAEPLPEIPLSLEELARLAAQRRPESRLVAERKELAVAMHQRERLRLVPWPTFVEARYHYDTGRQDRVEVMLGIELPLFDWNRDDIRASALGVERKETQTEALAERLGEQLRERHTLYLEAKLDLELSSDDAATLIAQTAEVASRAAEHGTVPGDELLELELLVIEARELLSRKRHALALALAELYLTVGVEGAGQLVVTGAGHGR